MSRSLLFFTKKNRMLIDSSRKMMKLNGKLDLPGMGIELVFEVKFQYHS